MFAAIYARISSDPTGQGLGVARQEVDCRTLIAARGWTLAQVYVDNDVSAYSGKRRPAYERLLADIEAGTVRAVVAWHADRLHRSPTELERFIDLAERTGLRVETVKAGAVDLSTASGRAVARTLGAWARYESEHRSDRVRRKLAENAAEGKHHGGTRPYGWEPDRLTVREPEAAIIREAAGRVLAGETLRSIVASLNERGIPTAQGRQWARARLRGILLSARNAGLREHKGTVVGKAAWPAIIEPERWTALCRLLRDPARTAPGRGGVLHLLSGTARCAVCGNGLRFGKSGGIGVYKCDEKGCVARSAEHLEKMVVDLVVGRLAMPDAVHLLAEPDDAPERAEAEREAATLRGRLDEAAESFADGLITKAQLEAATKRIRPRLEELEAATAPAPGRARLLADLITADDVRAAWEGLPSDVQRAVVAELLTIRIGKRHRRGPTFSVEGIDIDWR